MKISQLNLKLTNNLYVFLLTAFAFFLPLIPKVSIIIAVVICIYAFFMIITKRSENNLRRINTLPLWPMLLLYSFYVFGMLHSSNINFGIRDLETKLSLFILPLAIYFGPSLSKNQREEVFHGFAAGGLIACLFCYCYAIYRWYIHANGIMPLPPEIASPTGFFFYGFLSVILHPGYFAMYLNLALCFIMMKILFHSDGNKLLRWLYVFAMTIFGVTLVLLNTKSGVVTMFVIIILVLMYYLRHNKKNWGPVIKLIIPMAVLFFLVFFIPDVHNRMTSGISSIMKHTINPSDTETSALRWMAWKSSAELAVENPLSGTGTGDIKDELMRKYLYHGYTYAYQLKINSHNQYLQTLAAIGIPGLIGLLIFMWMPIYFGVKKNEKIFIFLILIIGTNFLIESVLETQAGNLFTGFFCSLILSDKSGV